jgi:hypothetical protein
LTSTIGRAPKYSISGRNENIDMSRYVVSPGPGNYSPKFSYLNKNLAYSMSARPNSSKSYITPGPGNYNLRTEKSLQVPTYK